MNACRHFFAALLLALLAAAPAPAQKSGLGREKGAVYVEDFTDAPVTLRLREAAPAYTDLTAQRSVGSLLGGQEVALIAFSDKACRVRGRAAHDTIVGWVGMKFLEAKDASLFDRLKQAAARQKQVDALIAKKEVAIGMTPDEVIQSLGRPDEETTSLTKDKADGSFSYITYDRLPQRHLVRDRYGRLVQTVTYIKVETGRLTVVFEGGAVSGVQTTKGRPNWNNARIVVPPIRL